MPDEKGRNETHGLVILITNREGGRYARPVLHTTGHAGLASGGSSS
ncbi:hypothetical protein [Streptomyces sp. NPDC058394]